MPEKNSFKISAELLQNNAAKESIRDLNAEFQQKGGRVIHKTAKKGAVFQLSHYDDEYLEQFRIRLLRELGVLEDSEVPEELKKKQAPPPRYGDTHKLRRGWNVRSPREINEGITDEVYHSPKNKGESAEETAAGTPVEADERPRGKSFEERWGDIEKYMKLIEDARRNGAVDDGDIIRHAYAKESQEDRIKRLKKLLWDNRCVGNREDCPYGKKKFKFEDLMKARMGNVEGLENIDTPFLKFFEQWHKNVEGMYGPFRDQIVEVEGKISSCKPVYRKGSEHLKILVYDTMIKVKDGVGDPVPTRKLWVRIPLKDFDKILEGAGIRLEDIIKFEGKCIFDAYFNDYWIVDLKYVKVVKEGSGDIISPVKD
ncbi:MAG: hypothetical protein KAX38_05565 [Candidatus Krumholzibacteria bacterium]|nr:hypothetical protein [Candidatus Krumholzibacteria bacterium]